MSPEELRRQTFDGAESLLTCKRITPEQFEEFCYLWRDSVFRWSRLGQQEAKRYAKRCKLAPPYSDRKP